VLDPQLSLARSSWPDILECWPTAYAGSAENGHGGATVAQRAERCLKHHGHDGACREEGDIVRK
jgi:hypothetical protein